MKSNKKVHILVFGSIRFSNDIHRKQYLCREIGKAIVSIPNHVLITGGALGGHETNGGADFHAAHGAYEDLLNRRIDEEQIKDRIITVCPSKSAEESFQIGKVIFDESEDVQQRRMSLVAMSNWIISVEGSQGTLDLFKYAVQHNIPFIPIGGSGGASRLIWEDRALKAKLHEKILNASQEGKNALEREWNIIDRIVKECRLIVTAAPTMS